MSTPTPEVCAGHHLSPEPPTTARPASQMSHRITSALAYSTDSAGMHPSHTLPLKLRAIAAAGFVHIELGFPDLEAYAEQQTPGYAKLDNRGRGDLDTFVLVVHPFSEFEGYRDVEKRAEGFERAAAWFKVLKALDCEMLQVGSTDDPDTSADYDLIARDLRQLADEAAKQQPPIRIAYEMWAWGSHVNTWEHTWEVCKRVDRPNFGLCLDTFQICGSRNVTPDALRQSAQEQGISPLYAWSNAWRPVPFMDEACGRRQRGDALCGYLPVVDDGWRGPWSYEDMARDDPAVPAKWTQAAMRSYALLEEKLVYAHIKV
ncbi:xylose isomerase-like protein [Amylocystis lapponica]|nr:xylose isomerase-like protein [Amylocystis lapponica]